MDQVELRRARWPQDAELLRSLRDTVFVQEQQVPVDIEWDGRDPEAAHVLAFDDGRAIGCGRLLPEGKIGRLAVLADRRGQGVGAALLGALMQEAQRQCLPFAILHAQRHASEFYRRQGFVAEGEPFSEAGIEHIAMRHAFDYTACVVDIPAVTLPFPFAELCIALARGARRELCLLSPRLDGALFERAELIEAMTALLRRQRAAQVRILVQDADAVVRSGHRLLGLAQRAQSRVALRALAEHPEWTEETLVLRDRSGLLWQDRAQSPAHYRPEDRGRAQQWRQRFEGLWHAATVPASFRRLTL